MKNNALIISLIAAGVLILGANIFIQHKAQPISTGTVAQPTKTFSIKSDSVGKDYAVNTPNEYSFTITDPQGNTLKNFAVTHTKLLHLIVVRKDLTYFQHVHPEFDASTGTFTLKDLTFPADGTYRIFADFAPEGASMDAMGMAMTASPTPFEDVTVGNASKYIPQPIGTMETTKTFGDLKVTLATHGTPASGSENMLMFSLSSNGKPVTDLQPYLGALGHAVILRQGTLDFIHAHPLEDVTSQQNGMVNFMIDFPEAGTYKVFTQFQRAGQVITTDFVLTVAQGTNTSSGSMEGMNMPGMQMH